MEIICYQTADWKAEKTEVIGELARHRHTWGRDKGRNSKTVGGGRLYSPPIFSEIPNGTFGCGAPAEDNVYEDPYAAEGYPWEVEARVWNEFQAKYHNITAEESDRLISKRQRDIEEQKAEFDRLPKRRRDDDYYGFY